MVLLGAAVFATFSLIVACLVKTRERFMGIGQVLTMPLFFASNAIYPIEIMPGWLRVVSKLNPLSYLVDVLRTLMVQGGHSAFGVPVDVGVELGALILLVAVAARVYPSVLV
jgi:ABC-2 type transport system permease protein